MDAVKKMPEIVQESQIMAGRASPVSGFQDTNTSSSETSDFETRMTPRSPTPDFLNELLNEPAFKNVSNAYETVKGVLALYENRQEIAACKDPRVRNKKILNLTGLVPEGDEFCSGSTIEQRLSKIEGRMQCLMDSCYLLKSKNYAPEEMRKAFDSDPCFNARLQTLETYLADHTNMPQEKPFGTMSTKQAYKAAGIVELYLEKKSKSDPKFVPEKQFSINHLRICLEAEDPKLLAEIGEQQLPKLYELVRQAIF